MGYGHVWGALAFFASVIGTLVLVVVLAGLIFLLVRFLLVATTAAKIYVAKNAPATTVTAATATPPAAAETPTRPRTPKAPPAV